MGKWWSRQSSSGRVRARVLGPVALAVAVGFGGIAAIPANAALTTDLAITMTDGVTTATAGGSVTYSITASNAGPTSTMALVTDLFPVGMTVTWTCAGAGGGTCAAAGSGDIAESVNLPVGASVTYTATGTVSPAQLGVLTNTASVAGVGVLDVNLGNNSATDTDAVGASADLSIAKTDGVTTAVPGGSVTYTITASNAGPSDATGATVTDVFPVGMTATWTCVGAGGGICTAAGSGNIVESVNLPSGASVTYTATATVSPLALGTLVNTATVSGPVGVIDPNPGNNSATDTDSVGVAADLSITKTDGVATAAPGGSVTYTIKASNAGPSSVSGATVTDLFPSGVIAAWTCVGSGGGTCPAAGSGNINQTVNLPSGGSVTYTATATISPSASGVLTNTATVSGPDGVIDPNPVNNSATDTDTLGASADLSITKTDGVTTAPQGGSVTYTIKATNAGPSNASGATVADTFPAGLTATWTCVGAGGGTCTAAGSGSINDTVNLPSGGSVTYTAIATVSPSASGTLSNTATVAAPGGVTDPNTGNNSATDTDTVATPPAAPSVTGSTPSFGAVSVKFTPGADGGRPVTGFTAQCVSTDGGSTGTATGPSSPLKVAGLTGGKSYHCQVRATNAVGASAYSPFGETVVVPAPATVPAAPSVQRSKPSARAVVVTFAPGADGGSPITSYKVTCVSKNGGMTRSRTGVSSPLKVKRLTPGKTYRCKVVATNAVGTGTSSAPGKKFKVPKRHRAHRRPDLGMLR